MEEKKKDPIVEKWKRFGMLRELSGNAKVFTAHSCEDITNEFHLYDNGLYYVNKSEDSITYFNYIVYVVINRIYKDGNFLTQIPKDVLADFFHNTTIDEILQYIDDTAHHDWFAAESLDRRLKEQRTKSLTTIEMDDTSDMSLDIYLANKISKLAIQKITEKK